MTTFVKLNELDMANSKSGNKRAGGGRVRATTPKAGVTKNRSRKYGCGGNIKNK